MSEDFTPIGIAMAVLVSVFALGLVLIPVLDNAIRRQRSRRPVNDNQTQEKRRCPPPSS